NIEAGLPYVNLSVSKLPGSAFLGERKGSFDCDNFAKRRVNEPRLVQTYLATTVFVNALRFGYFRHSVRPLCLVRSWRSKIVSVFSYESQLKFSFQPLCPTWRTYLCAYSTAF